MTVTAPGAYRLAEADYFAHDSLSFSGAKLLLPPGCPALFKHFQTNPRPDKSPFDFGHTVHSLVLGEGEPVVAVDADDWRGKAARDARDAARAIGSVPLLRSDYTRAKAAADAVLSLGLFTDGVAEESLFWLDEEFGVWRRCRIDYRAGRRALDLKTCISAEPEAISKTVANYRYYMQHPWYLDGIAALGLAEDPTFTFVFVEKDPPHLVTVCELDAEAVRRGRALNRKALGLYAECVAFDSWPAYTTDVATISLPRWAS